MKEINCTVCSADDYRHWHQVGEYTLVQCKNCGFIYVNPRPTAEELKETYSEDYYQSFDMLDWDKKTSYFEEIISQIKPFVNKGRLLEIGCAMGYFLDTARQHGFDCEAVEFSQWASNYAREERGLKVFTGNLLEAKLTDNAFDLIASWEVLEHVIDLREYFAEIKRILKPGGWLAFSLPNIDSLVGYFKNDVELMPQFHFSHFSPKTLKRFLEQYDFKIKYLKTTKVISWKTYLSYLGDRLGLSWQSLAQSNILLKLIKLVPAIIWDILAVRLLANVLDLVFSMTNRNDRMIVIAQLANAE